MAKITYNNKTALITNPDIADENKITDSDMNEIKSVVNENDDKFLTNGLNVSNEVDEDYRVNFLKGTNLFDGQLEIGTIKSETGQNIDNITRKRSVNYISVKPSTQYALDIQTTGNVLIFEYNQNGTFIGTNPSTWTSSPYTFTTTTNTRLVRFITDNTSVTQAQLNEGSTALPYEAFVPNSIKVNGYDYTETIGVGTNLDSRSRVNILKSKNLLNYNTSVNGVFTVNSTSETLDANNTAITSAWIPCEPNTTYRLYNPNGTSARQRWQTKASNGTITYMGETKTLTTNSTAKYMRVYYYVGSTATSPSSITNVQIEKGSEFTGFEPYITPSINVDNEEIYNQNIMNYSTSEQVVGKWINGKPLYRQVFNIPQTTISSSGATTINLISNNTLTPTKIEGMIGFTTSNTYYPLTGSTNRTATGYQVRWQNAQNLQIVIDSGQSAEASVKGGYVILEYTKTTD